jgi:type I restriction enzyme S subunit
MPPNRTEQTAIATILSDMDAEIDALTAKMTKARNIKQGMMQELLTGRIRLVAENAETEVVPDTKHTTKIIELPKSQTAAAQSGEHNPKFDDAVMIAGIVDVLYSDKYPLGRKKVQKCLYLLRRHQDKSTAAFKKKAAGPYADEVRYKGGEPIARNAKYIVTTSSKGKGTTFARGDKIGQALSDIQRWGRQAEILWIADKLKYKNVDELELLATVDMAICDLKEADTPVSVASIKHLIATNKEWKAKLKKQTFNDDNIASAIKELQTLL